MDAQIKRSYLLYIYEYAILGCKHKNVAFYTRMNEVISPLCAGVDPLSFLSFTETTPVSMSILKCDISPLYAAAWAGNARSRKKVILI
jgi:hypothetical protein